MTKRSDLNSVRKKRIDIVLLALLPMLLVALFWFPAKADRILVLHAGGADCDTRMQKNAASGIRDELGRSGHALIDLLALGLPNCSVQGNSLTLTDGIRTARETNANLLLIFDMQLTKQSGADEEVQNPFMDLWRFDYRVDLYDVVTRESRGGMNGEGMLPSKPTSFIGGRCNQACIDNWKNSVAFDIGREIAIDILFRQNIQKDQRQARILLRNVPINLARRLREKLGEFVKVQKLEMLQSDDQMETLALVTNMPVGELSDFIREFLRAGDLDFTIAVTERLQGTYIQVLGRTRHWYFDEKLLLQVGIILFGITLAGAGGRFVYNMARAKKLSSLSEVEGLHPIGQANRLLKTGWLLPTVRERLNIWRDRLVLDRSDAASIVTDHGTLLFRAAGPIELGRPVGNQCNLDNGHALAVGKIHLNNKQISRLGRQSKLFLNSGRFYIEDLGSTNGTYMLDQSVVDPMILPLGEVHIRLGGRGGADLHLRIVAENLVLTDTAQCFWCIGNGTFSFVPKRLKSKGVKPSSQKISKKRLMARFSNGSLSVRGSLLTQNGLKLDGWIPVSSGDTLEWDGEPLSIKTHREERL